MGSCLGASEGRGVDDGCANVGFGDGICELRVLDTKGEGVRALRGKGDLLGLGDIPPLLDADVTDLFIGGRLFGDAPVFSNILISDVVGGIGVRSSG